MDTREAIAKLLVEVESVKTHIDIKLEVVKERVSNIDDKLTDKVKEIEKKLETHASKNDTFNDVLIENDKKWEKAKSYAERIDTLEEEQKQVKGRVEELEKRPTEKKASFVDEFLKVLKGLIYVTVSGAIIAFAVFLIMQYLKALNG